MMGGNGRRWEVMGGDGRRWEGQSKRREGGQVEEDEREEEDKRHAGFVTSAIQSSSGPRPAASKSAGLVMPTDAWRREGQRRIRGGSEEGQRRVRGGLEEGQRRRRKEGGGRPWMEREIAPGRSRSSP